MQHTPEDIFARLVVNEIERHEDNMRHLMHAGRPNDTRQLDECCFAEDRCCFAEDRCRFAEDRCCFAEDRFAEDMQNEVSRHNAEMMQYAADMVSTWASTTERKDVSTIADDAILANIQHFIEKDAIAICDIKFALFPIIGAHYNMDDKGRSKLLPSIVAAAYRLLSPQVCSVRKQP